ncbi:hypothetical protein AMECASPLE_023432 [Ameca splendens]|uniref:Uncharacterized protein n=1 Tax=Ameca splendens TaxID=208324 RepID=A0ABV0Z248_9TELE
MLFSKNVCRETDCLGGKKLAVTLSLFIITPDVLLASKEAIGRVCFLQLSRATSEYFISLNPASTIRPLALILYLQFNLDSQLGTNYKADFFFSWSSSLKETLNSKPSHFQKSTPV